MLGQYEAALARGELLPDDAQRAAALRLDALCRCLQSVPQPGALQRLLLRAGLAARGESPCRGIYLWGGVGRGKTLLMDRFRAQLRLPSQRLHFQHFMQATHARLRHLRHRERPLDAVAAQFARRAPVLCLDELQVQDVGDAMLLHGLFAGLFERGVVLVITSNTAPQRLYEGGLQRERFLPAIALLQRQLDVVEIAAGPDYRLRQLGNPSTWIDAAAPDADARLAALFSGLSGGVAAPAATELEIEGRRLPARALASGIGWFDFATLCEGPRSADDYIALAAELHTLLLSDVPVMGADRDDAARRFIALIDELYDRRVKLVASAHAEPEGLYRGQRLRAAFERTASRLIEMRGSDYLSRAHLIMARPPERAGTGTARRR